MKRKTHFRLPTFLFAVLLLFGMMPASPVAAAEEPGSSISATATAEPGVQEQAQGSVATTETSAPDPAPQEEATATTDSVGGPGFVDDAVNNEVWADSPCSLEITSPDDGVLRSATGKIAFTYQTQYNLSSLNATDMPDQLSLNLSSANWPGAWGDSDGKVVFDLSSLKVTVDGQDVTAQGQWWDMTDSAYPEYPGASWSMTGVGAAALIALWSGKTITVKGTMAIKDPATIGAVCYSQGYIGGNATLTKTGATSDDDLIYDEGWSENGSPGANFEVRIGLPDSEYVVYVDSNALFAVSGNPGYVFLDPNNPSLKSLPKLTDPTGVHKFLGWSNNPGVNNEVNIGSYDDVWNWQWGDVGGGMLVYAVWSGDDDQLATLTIDSNGAGFPQAVLSYPAGTDWRWNVFDDYAGVPDGWQTTYTDSAGVHYLLGYSTSPVPYFEDYDNGGWPGDAPSPTWDANLTLYALWSRAIPVDASTISFNFNRDAGDLDTVPNGFTPPFVVTFGQPLSASFYDLGDGESPPSYIDDTYWDYGWPQGPDWGDAFSDFTIYYHFQGWSTDPGPNNTVNVDLNTVVDWTGPRTVYAVWDEILVPNAQVWANDPNDLKITSPADATLRSVDGVFNLSYTTSYDLSMVDQIIMPDTLIINLWTYQDPQVGINTDTLEVFVDGVDVTDLVSLLVSDPDTGDPIPAEGLQEDVYLEVEDPALIAAWSGKKITVQAQAQLMRPDEVELPCKVEGEFVVWVALYNSALLNDESIYFDRPPVFHNQRLIDEENDIWSGFAPYSIDIPVAEEPPVNPPVAPEKDTGKQSVVKIKTTLPKAGDSTALSLETVGDLLGLAVVLGFVLRYRRREA